MAAEVALDLVEQATGRRAHQVIEVKLADHEQVRSLIYGVGGAVALLAGLTEDEKAGLPEPAQAGISALFAACEGIGVERPRNLRPYGSVIIEWAPRRRDGYVMPGWDTAVFDAVSGKPITTASKVTIVNVYADDCVTADLTLLADPDGEPVTDGCTVWPDENGNIRTGVFRYYVAEMRVRQP